MYGQRNTMKCLNMKKDNQQVYKSDFESKCVRKISYELQRSQGTKENTAKKNAQTAKKESRNKRDTHQRRMQELQNAKSMLGKKQQETFLS